MLDWLAGTVEIPRWWSLLLHGGASLFVLGVFAYSVGTRRAHRRVEERIREAHARVEESRRRGCRQHPPEGS